MNNPRDTVDPKATNPLRFDDEAFLDELVDAKGDFKDRLEGILGEAPAEAVFDGLVADDVVILARAGVYSKDDDTIGTRSQQTDAKKGIKVDVGEANRAMWATWVRGVEADWDKDLLADLCSRHRPTQEEAFGKLPSFTADALMARLVVYVKHQRRAAMRDPRQTEARPGKGLPERTSANSSGEPATAQMVNG